MSDNTLELKVQTMMFCILDAMINEGKPLKLEHLLMEKDQKINPLYQSLLDAGLASLKQVHKNVSKGRAGSTRFIQLPGVSDQDI
jgi:hypothetical protein